MSSTDKTTSLPFRAKYGPTEPDPLDVDYYGIEHAPREVEAAAYVVPEDNFLWRVLRKELIGVDLSNKKLHLDEIRRYQHLILERLGALQEKQTTAAGSSDNSVEPKPLIRLANQAYNLLETMKHSTSGNRTVNPTRAYRENLDSINTGGLDHVRLYRFCPRAETLHLQVFPLRKCPKFAALSYTWHDGSEATSIGALTITTDLKAALTALAWRGNYEWLWIDILSINQAHPSEKSNQVRMMKKIYERADAVYVWIGRSVTTSSDKMPSECADHPSQPFACRFIQLVPRGEHAWWSRLWVVQEIVSAKRAWVCTGQHMCSWDDFHSVVSKVSTANNLTCQVHAAAFSRVQLEAAQARLRQLFELRKLLRSSPGGEDILELLRLTNPYHCSNPRDKVYGILGLATARDQRGIAVDYTADLATVFGSVVFHLASSRGQLDIMVDQWFHSPDDAEIPSTWPSWVPDFSRPLRREPRPLVNMHSYHASGSTIPSLRTPKNRPSELKLLAVRFDVVDDIMNECISDSEEGEELETFRLVALPSMETFAAPALRRNIPKEDPLSSIDRSESLSRCLVVDHGEDRMTSAPKEFGEIIDMLLETGAEDSNFVTDKLAAYGFMPLDLIEQIRQTMRQRALFTTSKGFVGVGMSALEQGDIIIVALGASVPFAVRETKEQGRYQLVGDVYLHGVMNGELMKIVDAGKLDTQPFTLV